MYKYHIYGLNILSTRKINLLNEVPFSNSDLKVDWNISNSKTPDNNLEWKRVKTEFLEKIDEISVWETDSQNESFTKVVFERNKLRKINFILDSKKETLSVYHHKDELISDLESYFVGPVLGFTLRFREIICLHSSVVGIDGKAIAFLGHSTAGKSTIAAGMANLGAEILSDDVGVLSFKDDGFMVHSGYSKIRLRPKAANFLTDNPENLPKVYSMKDSRYFSLENNDKFHSTSLPLSAIYVLGEISDDYKVPLLKPIESQKKLMSLFPNTIGSYVVSGDLRAKEFKVLAQIAKTLPMRQLYYAHDITTLTSQCELILEDFSKIVANPKSLVKNV